METVLPRLYATAPQPLSFASSVGVRSFLLERDEGNLLVYSSSTIKQEADLVRKRGGIWRQYLSHAHENEKDEISRVRNVDGTFSGRHTVGGDFEVVPIPGHTSGATAFLWDTGDHRCLFTGDSIMLENGEWVAALLPSSDRDDYIESLELIRELDFDVIVPWAATLDGSYYGFTGKDDARQRIDRVLDEMRRN